MQSPPLNGDAGKHLTRSSHAIPVASVIIKASQLLGYLSKITFPVDILAEKSEMVVFRADRERLEELIQAAAVIGIGSRNCVKRIRLNTLQEDCTLPLRAMYESYATVEQIKGLPIAGDAIRLLMHRERGPVTKPIFHPVQRLSATREVVSVPYALPWPMALLMTPSELEILRRSTAMHRPGEACS